MLTRRSGHPPDSLLLDTLAAVRDVEGWLSDAQAERLFERAGSLSPGAAIVEIGTCRGRSAIVLARAAPAATRVVAIDPYTGNDRGPREFHTSPDQGEADLKAFRRNIERAGVAGAIEHVRLPSRSAHGAVSGPIDLVYVDGSHRYRDARDDMRRWGARVRPGGCLMVHDSFCAIGVTLASIRQLCFGGRFLYAGRTGTLSEYERVDVRGLDRVRNAGRQLAELPWFLRNLLVKVALKGRLRPLARVLGHRSADWPY